MKFKDYYKILGVEDSASQDDIKRAYRKKARQYHPDVSKDPNAEEHIKSVNEAYEVLRNPSRRAEFDQLKQHGFQGGDDFRRPSDWQGQWDFDAGTFQAGGDFSDFFNTMFGGASEFSPDFRGGRHAQGDDIQLQVHISLEQAYGGCEIKIKVPKAPGYPEKTLSVKIPAGAVDGQLLRLRGQGRPGARNGDLILNIKFKSHPHFQVENSNIVLPLPITLLESIEGAHVEVPTLGGKVSLKIPPNTASGTRMRIKGRGLPSTPAGDQIVVAHIALPAVTSDADKETLRSLESRWKFSPRSYLDAEESAS